MRFQAIARVEDPAVVRVLLVALRAHGFHPLEPRDGGFPGVPNLIGREGIGIEVPEDEAADASILVADLLKDMEGAGT